MKHPVVFTRNARRVAVLAAGGLAGCLSRPSLQKERFAFPVPPREPGRGKWVLELRAPRVAALRMNFVFSDRSRPGQIWLRKDYRQSVALRARTAAALMDGWGQALRAIMSAVAADLAEAKD